MNFTKENLFNIYFIGGMTLLAVIGTPLYIYHYGLSTAEIALTVFYIFATGLGVTVGYHRLFSHVTYKTSPFITFLLLFFGAGAYQQSALAWASQHRDHHRYVDTENDPYSIKKGFFWAHMGWMFFGKYRHFYGNVGDLSDSKLVMHQARNYPLWCLTSGLVVPVLIGALMGHALGAFVLAVCFRVIFVYHGSWAINSVCHSFGKPTYDSHATARDHWLVAFISFGEGFHSFHHRFPNDFRNGVRWYHWDPSKWIIALFEKTGVVWDVKRASSFRILDARVKADNRVAMDSLKKVPEHFEANKLQETLKERYELLHQRLLHWEAAFKEYCALVKSQAGPQHKLIQQNFREKVEEARRSFFELDRQWKHFIEYQIPIAVRA
jgi:stearoyl-CoA desaturase (delta-9 desaturase)